MPTGSRKVDTFTQMVAAEFRAAQARQQVSAPTLSEQSGVALGTVRKILRGDAPIDVNQLYALCRALELDPRTVIHDAEAATKAIEAESNVRPLKPRVAIKKPSTEATPTTRKNAARTRRTDESEGSKPVQ